MVAAFPLGKLFYLGIKQLSKPISKRITAVAVNWPFVRRLFLIPPAQLVHRLEVFVKMRLMGAEGPTHVKALNPEQAAKIGAEMIGEAFVYSIAASAILFEYYRGKRKEAMIDEKQDTQISELVGKLDQLNVEVVNVKMKIEALEKQNAKPAKKKT